MIYVNGDSFTQKSNGNIDYSWPTHLQNRTCQIVMNQAAGCGSNSRMTSKLYDLYSLDIRPQIVIIALSGHSRWHLPSANFSAWNLGNLMINDQTGDIDNQALKWYWNKVFDQLEFVRQYYNQIWLMNEFCRTHLDCPIIFFNAWDEWIIDIEDKIFGNKSSQQQWILENSSTDSDIFMTQYEKVFDFYKKDSSNWIRFREPWIEFLNPKYIDPKDGEHPFHPSRQGHELICEYILSKIQKNLPTIYNDWSIQ